MVLSTTPIRRASSAYFGDKRRHGAGGGWGVDGVSDWAASQGIDENLRGFDGDLYLRLFGACAEVRA